MARHGCLCQTRFQLRTLNCAAIILCAPLFAVLIFTAPRFALGQQTQTEDVPVDAVDITLDWTWSSDRVMHWNQSLTVVGEAEVSNVGKFVDFQNHCNWSYSTGAFRMTSDGKSLLFQPRMASKNGAAQIRFRGSPDAILSLSPQNAPESSDESSDKPTTIKVADLIAGIIASDSQSQTTWTIRRRANDALKIRFGDTGQYVAPDTNVTLSVQANALSAAQLLPEAQGTTTTDLAAKKLELRYQLVRVSDGVLVSEKTLPIKLNSSGTSEAVAISDRVPSQAGVYEVQCRIVAKDKVWNRLRWSRPEYAMSTQPILVLPKQSADRPQITWKQIGDIQPAKQQGWELKQWLPANGRLPSPMGPSTPGLNQAKHKDEVVSLLEPKQTYATALPKLRRNTPHRITVRYPAGQALQLKVEIASSDRFDQNVRSYFLQDVPSIGDAKAWQTQSILHYPQSSSEFVRLTNLSTGVSSFASVEVSAQSDQETESDPPTSTRTAALRLAHLGWVRQLVPDANPEGGFSAASYAMHRLFVAIERLNRYVQVSGYNGVVLPSNTGGRAWYPSQSFAPLRKFDPSSTDHLQTILRLASAKNLRVYVAVDPSAALTDIEAVMRSQPSSTNTILRQSDGRLSPNQYNLSQSIVQQRLLDWLREVDQQISAFPATAGIVVSCGPKSHTAPIANEPSETDTLSKVLQAFAPELKSKLLVVDTQTPIASANESVLAVIDSRTDQKSVSQTDVAAISMRSRVRTVSGAAPPPTNSPSALLELAQGLVTHDPNIVFVSENRLSQQWSKDFVATLRMFTSLPTESVTPIAGVDPAVQTTHVRHAYVDGKTMVLATNTAPWSVDIELHLNQSFPLDGVSKSKIDKFSAEGDIVYAKLSAGKTITLTLSGPNPNQVAPVKLWSSRVSGNEATLGTIKQQVTTVVERIGTLSDPPERRLLKNGGFEQPTSVGIPGWMHTQHPAGSVQLDARESVEGSQSVVLKSEAASANRTWIVSEQFKPTASGRVAVSLASRGELNSEQSEPHRLRVSIEGTRNDQPIRVSKDFDVPRDGQWQPRAVVLEATGIDPTTVDSIRLTIDSLSSGKVWIDDIQIHDWFPVANERENLQSDALMAVQGLQTGNLTPAAGLLQNYWARYLLAQQKPVPSKPILQVRPTAKVAEPPSVAERIKGWIPRPLRF